MYKKDFNKGQCGVPHAPPSGCPQEAALEDKPGNAAPGGGTAGGLRERPGDGGHAPPQERSAPRLRCSQGPVQGCATPGPSLQGKGSAHVTGSGRDKGIYAVAPRAQEQQEG